MLASEGPGLALAVIAFSALIGAAMSAMTAALHALPDELLMAVQDERGPESPTATRILAERAVIRARLLTGRVLSVTAMAAATTLVATTRLPVVLALLAVLAVGLVYALLAEFVQTLTRSRARVVGLRLLRLGRPLELAFLPLALPIQAVANLVGRAFPEGEAHVDPELASREVEHLIERREEDGVISEEFALLLRRVLEFNETVAREVMVPRTRMIAIDLDMPLDEMVAKVVEEGHSRFPMYRERVDRIEGILHAKDLFRAMREGPDQVDLDRIVRKPVLFVAESQKIGHVLREMQSKRQHLALVVDEFGGTAGVVTLEDILEEIVGEIQDEHDAEESLVTELGPGRYLVDASVSIHELGELLETSFDTAAEDAEVDSLGGLVVGLAGRVPSAGEQLTVEGLELIVRDADEKHVSRVEIRRLPAPAPSGAAS